MYDLVIIGAGIAGMTASIYASRYGLKHLILDSDPGGQGNLAHLVENYPGVVPIKGLDLMKNIIKQVESYGVEIKKEKVVGLEKALKSGRIFSSSRTAPRLANCEQRKNCPSSRQSIFVVKTKEREYQAKSLILAMGATNRQLNIQGEDKFLGKGVSYCTICDGPLFKNKTVALIGGGNAALSGALHLAKLAKKVYLIHRRNEFRAERAWVDRVRKKDNIEVILSAVVNEVFGKEIVEGIRIERALRSPTKNFVAADHPDATSGLITSSKIFVDSPHSSDKVFKLKIDGLFIEVGKVPSSLLTSSLGVELGKDNYVLVDADMKTNINGIFAAGDLCLQREQRILCQFVAAAAEGARAGASVYHYLTKKPATPSWGEKKTST